jgi:hypothetical protein
MSPRLSIIRGDFPTDQRADIGHFRVYTLIGRHTDAHGWCRLKQITIGVEVGLSRKTVNLKIADLVAWGYVEKCDTDATGRAIWYRTILDAPMPPPEAMDCEPDDDRETSDDEGCETGTADDGGPVTGALHVGCNTEATCNPLEVTPGVTTGRNTERPFLNDSTPLTPPLGGNSGKPVHRGRDKSGHTALRDDVRPETQLAALRVNARYHDAVDHLIAPLVTSGKRLAMGKGLALAEALAEIASAAAGLDAAALAAAARRLVDQPRKLTVALVRAELDGARRSGAMVVIRRGSPQWQRWAEHFEATDARQAVTMGRFDTWQVPAEWPPANHSAARGAA